MYYNFCTIHDKLNILKARLLDSIYKILLVLLLSYFILTYHCNYIVLKIKLTKKWVEPLFATISIIFYNIDKSLKRADGSAYVSYPSSRQYVLYTRISERVTINGASRCCCYRQKYNETHIESKYEYRTRGTMYLPRVSYFLICQVRGR